MALIRRILNSFIFWAAWIIIPVIMEIIPSLGSVFLLLRRRHRMAKMTEKPTIYPEISLIIPVYNSAQTLGACIESIYNSYYPTNSIRVFLVNNQGKDDSFSVFAECQEKFPELRMQWLNAEQGKSRALNLAIYNSGGKYVINIDSDGTLEPHALTNLIDKFEANPGLNVMTGTILINTDMIEEYKGFFPRLLRKLEFMEYAQAFLAGRSYSAEINALYTLSGAFSAFRKSALLQSWMYNTDTVGEDTHLTFQMRRMHQKVDICENAIFFVDPIEDLNKLYTQRQRWQRGSLEVGKMFMDKDFKVHKLLTNVNVQTLLYDHTFAFPRMIWYLAMLFLAGLHYSGTVVVLTTLAIFALYVMIGFLYFGISASLLRLDPKLRRYYLRHWWCVILLPLYNMLTFFIRLFGIFNSINTDSAWRTRDLTGEKDAFVEAVKDENKRIFGFLGKLRSGVNKERPEKKAEERSSYYSIGWFLSVGALCFVGIFLIFLVYWSRKAFGVEMTEIVATLAGPLDGTGGGMKNEVIRGFVIPIVCVIAVLAVIIIADVLLNRRLRQKGKKARFYRFSHSCIAVLGVVALLSGSLYGNAEYDLIKFYSLSQTASTLYEDYYVNPADVSITAPDGGAKNLIYLYVESLETTYAAVEDGGFQRTNYMPNLTKLARENISFSDVGTMGGSHAVNGTTWTMAALLASSAGVPYALPEDPGGKDFQFMPGIVNLGDILAEKGYVQEFLCGSDIAFARREEYYTQHGNYKLFDVYSAREAGYIPGDYWHNWGFEDKILFDIAKDELTALASQGKPFNFTMLTVDLHSPDGYVCEWCGERYENNTATVVNCNDQLISAFLEWCSQQDFYDDTVIVITGDHPRMDKSLVQDIAYYDRTVYNCFINTDTVCQKDIHTRTFTMLDLFPTTLAAMGFEIEGDRLGLGANLFSQQETVAESRGFQWLDAEVQKSSDFYLEHFAPDVY